MDNKALWQERILAIRIGMDTAAEIVRQNWGARYAQCAIDYERTWSAKVEARQAGCREMVNGDIFLSQPMMQAADIGWPQADAIDALVQYAQGTSPREGRDA